MSSEPTLNIVNSAEYVFDYLLYKEPTLLSDDEITKHKYQCKAKWAEYKIEEFKNALSSNIVNSPKYPATTPMHDSYILCMNDYTKKMGLNMIAHAVAIKAVTEADKKPNRELAIKELDRARDLAITSLREYMLNVIPNISLKNTPPEDNPFEKIARQIIHEAEMMALNRWMKDSD